MKFKKILTIGINEANLGSEHMKKLNLFAEQIVSLPKSSPEVKKHLADTDCLLVCFGLDVTKADIDDSPKLEYIGVLATAYGKIDYKYAKKKGIVVCNIPDYSTESVAEFTIAVILEHIRKLGEGKSKVREGDCSGDGFYATEIKNKKFGVLGLGNIGGRVAELALGFNADVRYWSRNRKPKFESKGIKYQDSDHLIRECDFLSINLAQTSDTKNFLNEKKINSLKKGAIVVNTAPMELVNIKALEKRLQSGEITFILDHSDEMKSEDVKTLAKYKNCIIYPPIAYVSKEAAIAKKEIFVKNIENFLKGSFVNVANK